ncbi:Pyruvate/Phosphoenolpyruvate kinase-like domain-containing protein [Mycena rosella]|uniref:methylisocitrate lyase n=1 Tax=Mycena rosella TaxID=1033263 RepID=A0AAD7DVF5_MYCRO|nr:Pyruvate/Phosphoenolpyruvate kinase-like domain-containing protein [Mycena rosella]
MTQASSSVLHTRRASDVDYMVPLIADADTDATAVHGSIVYPRASANSLQNIKLAKLVVEAGAAAIHLDDQVPGHQEDRREDRVLVPVGELVSRLLALKSQFDVMGSECPIIQRTNAETAGSITSPIDARDRSFILGSTNPALDDSVVANIGDPGGARDAWVAAAALTRPCARLRPQAARTARELGIKMLWDCEASRSREGWSRYRGNIDATIMRSVACARYPDVLWTRTSAVIPDLEKFAAEGPGASPLYDTELYQYYMGAQTRGSRRSPRGSRSWATYIWQFVPLAGLSALAVGVECGACAVREDGVLGLMKDVYAPGKKAGVSVLEKVWQGGELSDAMVAVVTMTKE